ncbi:MAG: extracellular solute-binding protein [Candidatus Dormibacteria bacterium]
MIGGIGLALDPIIGKSAGETVTFSTYGGSLDQTLRDAYLQPFTDATGIKVQLTSNASLATLKLQVQSGHPQLDLMVVVGSDYDTAVSQNLLEPVVFTHLDEMVSTMTKKYGFQYNTYAWGIVWSREGIGTAPPPRTWADFWDMKRYPGQRSLYDNLSDGSTLEAALIADGVPLNKLYPLDVPRALRSLDKLGKSNIVWYSTNQQPIQQITSGATVLATAFNGRVFLSNKNQGTHLEFVPNQSALGGSYLAVLKGAPNKDAAVQLLNSIATNSQGCVKFAEASRYGCVDKAAYRLMSSTLQSQLPGSPQFAKLSFVKDTKWWSENLNATTQQFKRWQLS